MTIITYMIIAVFQALFFGFNYRNKCEELLKKLELIDLGTCQIKELKFYATQLREMKPDFDEKREVLLEKIALVNKVDDSLTKFYNDIQEILEKEALEDSTEGEKVALEAAQEEYLSIPTWEEEAQKEDCPSMVYNIQPALKSNQELHEELQKNLQKMSEHPLFHMDTSKIGVLTNMAKLFGELTECQTNPMEILRAIYASNFDHFRAKFQSRNQFYVWLNFLFRSKFITSEKALLRSILHSERIKIFRDAFRKCRKKCVLKCCIDVQIEMNVDQRTWAEKNGIAVGRRNH